MAYKDFEHICHDIKTKWNGQMHNIRKMQRSLDEKEKNIQGLIINIQSLGKSLNEEFEIQDTHFSEDARMTYDKLNDDIKAAMDKFGGDDPEERAYYRAHFKMEEKLPEGNSIALMIEAVQKASNAHSSEAIDILKSITNEKYKLQAEHLIDAIEHMNRYQDIYSLIVNFRVDDYRDDYRDRGKEIRDIIAKARTEFLSKIQQKYQIVEYKYSPDVVVSDYRNLEYELEAIIEKFEAEERQIAEQKAREKEEERTRIQNKRRARINKTFIVRAIALIAVIIFLCGIPFVAVGPRGIKYKAYYRVPLFSLEESMEVNKVFGNSVTSYAPFLEMIEFNEGSFSSVDFPKSNLVNIHVNNNSAEELSIGAGINQINLSACEELQTLSISKNAKGIINDLDISYCPSFEKIEVGNRTVESISLYDCDALKEFNDWEWTQSVTLNGCDSLEEVVISSAYDVNITECPSLRKITFEDIPDYVDYTIDASSLEEINVPDGYEAVINESGLLEIKELGIVQ